MPTLNGVGDGVSLDSSGKLAFAVHKSFSDLTSAKTWLNSKAGIS